MNPHESTVARYIDLWNETEPQRRRALIGQVFAATARYTDPLAEVQGSAAIDALIDGAQKQLGGLKLALSGAVDTHHDTARFTWHVTPAGESEPLIVGFDVVAFDDDGRVAHVYGFLDKVPASLG